MTPEQLEEIERAVEAMTGAPWKADLDVFDAEEGIVACITSPIASDMSSLLATICTDLALSESEWTRAKADAHYAQAKAGQEMRDARGIVALRNSAPALLAHIRSQEERVRELEERLREAADLLADEGQRYELGPCRLTLYQQSDRLRALLTKEGGR